MRVHDNREGRGSREALATRGGRRMHGEGVSTPSTGVERCWPVGPLPPALEQPPLRPRRRACEWAWARHPRRLPPEAHRKLWRGRAARRGRADFLPAAQRSWLTPREPRRRLPRLPRPSPAGRPRPPHRPRLPWVCMHRNFTRLPSVRRGVYSSGSSYPSPSPHARPCRPSTSRRTMRPRWRPTVSLGCASAGSTLRSSGNALLQRYGSMHEWGHFSCQLRALLQP